jgi:NTP pyrophosphatase (non-canonical NTP hydrolase)
MEGDNVNVFKELEQRVVQWSDDRGIIEHSTPAAQTLKAMSEMGELADNILKHRHLAARDDIGDILVCLINVAAMTGTNLTQCLAIAYDEIKDRKGRMVPGGAFVKESDEV